jgi:hypothetical protein
MKKIIHFLLLFCISCNLQAKDNAMNTFIGFNQSYHTQYFGSKSHPSVKLGFNSFSFSSGLEHRFSINNKLKFSLQYSLAYFNFNLQSLKNTIAKQAKIKEFSAGLGVNAIYQFRKDACVITGFNLNKPIYTCFKTSSPSELPNGQQVSTQKDFDLQNINSWSPTVSIGIEKQIKLFNKDIRYSLQYNLGSMPYIAQFDLQSARYIQGISFGLKYKL